MTIRRSISIALVLALFAMAAVFAVTPAEVSAAPQQSGLQQPPPPLPPPPSGNTPGSGNAGAPPEPQSAPRAMEDLPDPSSDASMREKSVGAQAIAVGELEVQVDRGCGSQYNLNDPISFIGRRGSSQQYGYWAYMEIWNSTNNAWWTKLAADWVAPNGSLSRSGRIAEPTGSEQLYARLLDQNGNILDEAWCAYSSATVPTHPQIYCGQTVESSLNMNEQQEWSFQGNGGQNVRITMQGRNGFDTYLELQSPNGSLIASNDDMNAPYDLSSRIQVRLPSTGMYTIVARGFKYQPGDYSLSVDCN